MLPFVFIGFITYFIDKKSNYHLYYSNNENKNGKSKTRVFRILVFISTRAPVIFDPLRDKGPWVQNPWPFFIDINGEV